jgi:hypothetical protein
VLWFATGLRQAGRTELAGRLVRRALDVMGEVLLRDGTIYEFYDPRGGEQEVLRRFDTEDAAEPVRRYYMGHAPVRAMVLCGLFGIRPTRDGLIVDPAGESIPDGAHVSFKVGDARFALDARRRAEGMEITLKRDGRIVAQGYGRTLVPRIGLL